MKKYLLSIAILFSATMILACGGSNENKSEDSLDEYINETVDNQENLVFDNESDSDSDEILETPESEASNVFVNSPEEDASPSEDWDKVLDEYENYVDKYIKTYKKAMNDNDMNAMMEYASLMESAQRLSDKLEHANDEMTTKQMNRYMKITNKMANAMQ